jgi:MHS family proline/betaine transporter-like MFS transporter
MPKNRLLNKFFSNGLALGHVVECFDNTLYGFFSVLLAPVFFPSTDPFIQTLASFGAFAAGYITKPLGAIVFGIIGDSTNRNFPLVLSMALVGIPTLIIGLLPSYESIGIWAPVVLIMCRLCQGFFFGGEFPGANVYIFETSSKSDLGKYTGYFIASGVIGAILSTLAGAIAVLAILPSWSWRIPFIFGGLMALATFQLRKKLELVPCTPHPEKNSLYVLSSIFKDYKKEVIFCIFLSGLTTIPLNLVTVYSNKIFHELGFSPSEIMGLDGIAMVFNAFFLIASGYLADRIGFIKMIELGIMANIALALPAFWLLTVSPGDLLNTVGFILILIGTGTLINGCAFPYMASFFAPSCRYSGLAISYTLGIALLSGTAPVIATFITYYFHSEIMVAWYLIGMSSLTFLLHRFLILRKLEYSSPPSLNEASQFGEA